MTPSTMAGIPSRTKSQRQPAISNQERPSSQPASGEPIMKETGMAAMKFPEAFARSSRMNQ